MTEGVAATRWPGLARLREWPRRYPLLTDLALMLLMLTLLGFRNGGRDDRIPVLLTISGVLLIVPVVLRRRYPLAVFGFMAAIAFLHWLSNRSMLADAALLVALYSVAAYGGRVK